jgi:hypothetical protein
MPFRFNSIGIPLKKPMAIADKGWFNTASVAFRQTDLNVMFLHITLYRSIHRGKQVANIQFYLLILLRKTCSGY